MKEQLNIKTEIKEKRLKYEVELEERPEPLEKETLDVWIKRIGGPNVKLVESFKEYKMPKSKEKTPLMINSNGNFVLNNENIGTYFNKEKLDALLEKKNPNIKLVKKSGEYRLKKELFKKPELYFKVIGEELKEKRKIIADKRFGQSLEKWTAEAKRKEKPEEEPEKQKTIAELEGEIERLQTAYAPLGWLHKKPVVRDLGYYANQNKIEEIKKEIEKLKSKKPDVTRQKLEHLGGKQAGPPQSEGLGGEEKAEEKTEESVKTGAIGGGIRMGESAEDIENRLQELSVEIPASGVLSRSKLEEEQKKLEKRLKKLKKKKKIL